MPIMKRGGWQISDSRSFEFMINHLHEFIFRNMSTLEDISTDLAIKFFCFKKYYYSQNM